MTDAVTSGGEEGSNAGTGAGDEATIAAKAAEDAAAAKAAEEGKKNGEDAAAAKAAEEGKKNGEDATPIQYEAFQMPEGMEVDVDALAVFTPLAQEFKIPQEKAQELANIMGSGLKKQADAHVKAWAEAMGKWQEEAKADQEIGGDKFTQTEANVARTLKKLGPADREDGTNALQDILKITGVGNHVEIVRIFSKIGAILADDTLDFGRHLGDAPKTRAEILFPNQGQQ